MVKALGGKPADAKRLVDVGLWSDADGGYRFHQWNDQGRQPTREKVEQDREDWRERQRKSRANKGDQDDTVTPMSRRESR